MLKVINFQRFLILLIFFFSLYFLSGCESYKVCSTCNGTGVIACENCSGRGYIEVTCSNCNGTGQTHYYDPFTHETIYETCKVCHGTGKVSQICSTCRGTGEITCPDCNGTGEVKERVLFSIKRR